LIARHLEAAGIPTVIMGCARDIVEQAAVARYYWSDFPLGHSAGKPHDLRSQADTLSGALAMFDACNEAQTTHVSPQVWAADEAWKIDFMNADRLDKNKLEAMRAQHEKDRAVLGKLKS
jgi:hypothetical protein